MHSNREMVRLTGIKSVNLLLYRNVGKHNKWSKVYITFRYAPFGLEKSLLFLLLVAVENRFRGADPATNTSELRSATRP